MLSLKKILITDSNTLIVSSRVGSKGNDKADAEDKDRRRGKKCRKH